MNNNYFELEQYSGPHGDQTYSYYIKFSEPITVGKFLECICKNKQEFGFVSLLVPNPETYNLDYASENEKLMGIVVRYEYGNITTDKRFWEEYIDCEIDILYKNYANGGWSLMYYWVKIK